MYIQRSILLLFIFLYLLILVGLNWMESPGASWYRPFILALVVVIVTALFTRNTESDEF